MNLVETIRALIARRVELARELAAIEADLAAVRDALGLPPSTPPEPAIGTAPTDGILKACKLCGQPYTQRSNRQKMCPACTATSPHRPVETLAGTASPDTVCERCLTLFRADGSNGAGKFCTRACYEHPDKVRRAYHARILRELLGPGRHTIRSLNVALHASYAAMKHDVGRLVREGRIRQIGKTSGQSLELVIGYDDQAPTLRAAVEQTPTRTIAPPNNVPAAVVAARDVAVMRQLKLGPRDVAQLCEALQLNAADSKADLERSLRRLELRGRIEARGDQWATV